MKREFVVTWTVYVSAEDETDAAREALKIQRDPASGATGFTVKGQNGTVEIDLDEDE